MATSALIIKVNAANKLDEGKTGSWINDLSTQMPRITNNIVTPDIQGEQQAAAIVSGIPTPFARPVLFEKAIGNASNTDKDMSAGLQKYYASLVDEWRGLIACLALDPNIQVETIKLAYSDGKSFKETQNIYEPKGAFGSMLLDERNLWCDQTAADFKLVSPEISIIKYGGKVIGGTSPKVLVFTSSYYQINADAPYVNPNTKHLTDPLKLEKLKNEEYLALYAYVRNLIDNFGDLKAYFKENGPDYTSELNELQRWLSEIDAKIVEKNLDKTNASPYPVSHFTQEPFRKFFNYSDDLFAINGIVYSKEIENSIPFSPDELLLPDNTELVHILITPQQANDFSHFPLTLLRATKSEGTGEAFFALPLSETGIKVFEKNIDSLLKTNNTGSDIGSTLTAIYDEKENKLKVELSLVTNDGIRKPISKIYNVNHNILMNKDILIWPNFASAQWDKYYLYSEIPQHNDHSNGCPFETIPFCGECDTSQFNIIMKHAANGADEGIALLVDENGKAQKLDGLEYNMDVVSDTRTNDQRYKYEIYESNKPFRGVQVMCKGKVCGYALIRYTADKDDHKLPMNYGANPMQLNKVNLGVDFGSTNTSVAYYSNIDGTKGFVFHNHRISLLMGLHNMPNIPTLESSVFFFQRETIQSNTIKSMLTLHDKLRLPERMYRDSEPVTGGFPCFNRNLPVSVVKGDHISLEFRNSGAKAEIVNDMKWKGDAADKDHKKAFLSTLMLHVYAELFTQRKVPETLKWSYPSSMGFNLLQQYGELWNTLKDLSPVIDDEGKKVNLKVYQCPGLTIETDEFQWNASASEEASSDGGWGSDAGGMGNNSPWGSDSQDVWGNGASDGQNADNQDQQGWGADNQSQQGWGSDNSAGGWGSESSGGWGSENGASGWDTGQSAKPKIKDLVPDDGPIEFELEPLPQDTSLTEACAVANYMVSNVNRNVLTLCFDIGGSTTDISAICFMKDQQGMPHPTLIKQNSIRFAAQRVSQATSVLYSKFKNVLLSTCNNFDLRLTGLNMGDDKYNADTASYFYEQIVDILTPEQQVAFYQKIAADCPELFSVNLYVTGLIMFYAGEITEKLVKEVRRSKNGLGENWRPQVMVRFAGKGSRIFDWFSCINFQGAKNYCMDQFLHGMGGKNAAMALLYGPPAFELSNRVRPDVKYEVAKGLASPGTSLYVPKGSTSIEILGEDGFSIIAASTNKTTPLPFDNSITTEMMEQLGVYFMAPSPNVPCKRFMDFAGVFYMYAKKMFGLKMTQSDFMQGFRNMQINNYIQNQPEFRAAKARSKGTDGKFDYVNPIIILEGMKFYEDYLLKDIAR